MVSSPEPVPNDVAALRAMLIAAWAERDAERAEKAQLVAECNDGAVTVAVVDHGPGVPPADRERIFEPFQRLGDQDMTTGVGLGLAVARGFVEGIGGQLTASETPGGGLTMTVHLTAAPAATRSERPQVDS